MDFLSVNDDYKDVVFKINTIGEDLDYGCEDRLEHTPVMAAVFLERIDTGKRYIVKVDDNYLYKNDILEGDLVTVTRDIHWYLHKVK